jgi:hypothetical protein
MIPVKTTTKLPARTALKGLDKTQRTIIDYGKLTPMAGAAPPSTIVQILRKPRI